MIVASTGHGTGNRGILIGEPPLHRNAQASPEDVFLDPDARTACRTGGRQA
ncbi:hypothetical protein GCM10011583_11290 [Streptomyces camponoticapitis]|uniref:Uncharacterized protein n=1 Tax=Streptomyces camponoticapitis TaxID=1616125 RepID=A0ABQ2E350_9ACTN|nr:hypothetical protein GCM10011583_11290 [Streptomyces camponoticapitis]